MSSFPCHSRPLEKICPKIWLHALVVNVRGAREDTARFSAARIGS